MIAHVFMVALVKRVGIGNLRIIPKTHNTFLKLIIKIYSKRQIFESFFMSAYLYFY